MITKPPSYQREYTDHWSGDSAFVPAPAKPHELAAPEVVKAYEAELEERERKFRVAREQNAWQPLLVENGQPTAFVMGQVDRNAWRSIGERMLLHPSNERWIGPVVLPALLFRLAVRRVVGLFDEITRAPDPAWNNWVMADRSVINELDDISPSIVGELGSEVFRRLGGLSPK